MKILECKKNMRVIDKWYIEYGIGIITKILKTRIHVQFIAGLIIYDISHLQFLKKVK